MEQLTIEQKRKKIINFMNWKDKILSEKVSELKRHEYFTKKDRKEVFNFTTAETKKIYNKILITTKKLNRKIEGKADIKICPFCIIYYDWSNGCKDCTYHDYCGDKDSTYRKIRYNGSILSKIQRVNIVKYLKRRFI